MKSTSWPAWFYGPGGHARVFASESEVPAGWVDHPSKVGAEKPAKAAPAASTPAPAASKPAQAADGETPAVDAHGHPWSADLHAATKNITKEGLWRMKVGVKRPDPLPGFPQKFDL